MPSDQEYLEAAGLQESGEPKTAEAPSANPATPEAAQAAQEMFEFQGNKFPVSSEFNLIHEGKTQKVPYTNLVNGYRRAAHYQQKWDEGSKQLKDFEQRLKPFDQYKSFYDKYNALQTWSEQHPEDWKRLEDIWKNKDQHLLASKVGAPGAQPELNSLFQEIAQMKNQLSEFTKMKETLAERETRESEEKDINFVKDEIVSFQKEFPEIDLNEKDPDGIPLWAKITQWGNSNGFIEFMPAAHMYLKSRLAELYGLRARQEATKSLKTDFQNGVVKRSATPIEMGQKQSPQNVRKLSYAEIAELAKSSLSEAS